MENNFNGNNYQNHSSEYSSSSSYSYMIQNNNNNEENMKKSNKKKRSSSRGVMKLSTDPQSVAARERRHRISDRFKILQSMVPGGSKMDTVSMLDEAIQYVKFLKTQIFIHQNMINFDDHNNVLYDPSFFNNSTSVYPDITHPVVHHLHHHHNLQNSVDDNCYENPNFGIVNHNEQLETSEHDYGFCDRMW